MRSLRSEFMSSVLVFSVPACILAFFPYSAIGFRSARHVQASRATASFVTLTEAQERLALKAVQSSWRGTGRRNPHVDLALGALPEERTAVEVLEYAESKVGPEMKVSTLAPSPFLPSMAAAAPVGIAAEAQEVKKPAFAREELLKLD